MCGKTRRDRIKNGNIRELERVGVTRKVEKMVETSLTWFGYVERRPVDSVVRTMESRSVGG
jgi:hypothetical protein